MKIFTFSRGSMFIGALTASVLLAGCQQVAQQVQTKVEQTVTQTGNNFLTEKDVAGISDPLVRKHFVAQANSPAFRIITKTMGKSDTQTMTEIQVSRAGMRFHTSTTLAGKTNYEMIVIDDTTYAKDPRGVWWKESKKQTTDSGNEVFISKLSKPDEIKTEFTKKQNGFEYKAMGTEACGVLTCYKYQEVNSESREPSRTFWFDNQSFLLRREEQKMGESLTTNEYTYGDVNINVPSPAKDVPEGKSVFEYMQ